MIDAKMASFLPLQEAAAFITGTKIVQPGIAAGDPVPESHPFFRPVRPGPGKLVVLVTPCDDGHKFCFWESLRRFEKAYLSGQLNTPHRFEVLTMPGDSLVPRARNNLFFHVFKNTDADFIFPIDSDLDFVPQDVLRMVDLAAAKDLDFLAGRYAIKEPGLRWCENALPNATPDQDGLLEIACAPGGIHMISRRLACAFVDAAPTWPHWLIRYTDDMTKELKFNVYFAGVVFDPIEWPDRPFGRYLSEDWGISYLARKLGFRVWCDTRTIMLHRGEIFYPIGAERMTVDQAAKIQQGNPQAIQATAAIVPA